MCVAGPVPGELGNRLAVGGVVVGVNQEAFFVQAGEAAGALWLRQVYAESYVEMVRLARLLVGDGATAEDLVQDAFAGLVGVECPNNPPAYVRMVVVNRCRNWQRSRQRLEKRLRRHGPSPTETSIRARELDATLMRLPYRERAVIVLRYWLGLSEAEIAEALGCRPGTVKSRHSRALAKIRKELT